MAFTIEKFHNPYLPIDGKRVDAVLTVTAGEDAVATVSERVIGFIIDTSGSMAGDRIRAVTRAGIRAIEMLDPTTRFFVVTFYTKGYVICQPTLATPQAKTHATNQLYALSANGGTAMSEGLAAALAQFRHFPNAIRYAVFLTDGKNESETPDKVHQVLDQCSGVFEADCWGVGTDWQVGEVQEIARALLGKASLIPDPSGIEAAFRAAMGKAQGKAVKDVRLRLWTPVTVQTIFVKQVNPTIEDLTQRGVAVTPQIREYSTGAWGRGESRDYHVALQVTPGRVGEEMLAARPSIVYHEVAPDGTVADQEIKPPGARILASWTDDETASSRIDQHVAHYTGQTELANAIQEGLAKRAQGDDATATQLLGRAVQLAHASENEEMTTRLKKVVDVIDPSSGTVKLRKADKAAEMDLALESTTTKRTRRPSPDASPSGSTGGKTT